MESVIYILLNLFYDMSTHLAISSKTYIFVKIANINSFLRENQCMDISSLMKFVIVGNVDVVRIILPA